jgi:hypothetical protein
MSGSGARIDPRATGDVDLHLAHVRDVTRPDGSRYRARYLLWCFLGRL